MAVDMDGVQAAKRLIEDIGPAKGEDDETGTGEAVRDLENSADMDDVQAAKRLIEDIRHAKGVDDETGTSEAVRDLENSLRM